MQPGYIEKRALIRSWSIYEEANHQLELRIDEAEAPVPGLAANPGEYNFIEGAFHEYQT